MPIANPNGIRFVQTQHTTNTDKTHGQASSVGVYIGTVKDNKDPQNMGRLKVWIQDFGGNPEDQDRWISVSYAAPFAGTTSIFDQGSNIAEYADTIKSYGMWFVPPDIDARVLVTFASGRLDLGYWFACLHQTGVTGPLPGLPFGKTHTGSNKTRTNKNRKDTDPDIDLKVEHILHKELEEQGLDKDKLRGITTSGAERESPSKVFGILTPGQHQFVMDDGDKDGASRYIRLRTVGGTQLLLDDSVGHVYIISRDGKNWVEMSVDGRIHVFAEDDISLHSENNINMYAGRSINMQAAESVNIQGADTSMVFDGFGLNTVVTGDMRESVSGEASTKVVGQYIEYAALIHMNGPVPPDAVPPDTYILLPNIKVTKAIMPIVPEHEPWTGHSGSINPNGPGNRQIQRDPDPTQVAQEPPPGTDGIPVQIISPEDRSVADTEDDTATPIPIEDANASNQIIDFIRDENEYRGYPYTDGDEISAGYGSPTTRSFSGYVKSEADYEAARNGQPWPVYSDENRDPARPGPISTDWHHHTDADQRDPWKPYHDYQRLLEENRLPPDHNVFANRRQPTGTYRPPPPDPSELRDYRGRMADWFAAEPGIPRSSELSREERIGQASMLAGEAPPARSSEDLRSERSKAANVLAEEQGFPSRNNSSTRGLGIGTSGNTEYERITGNEVNPNAEQTRDANTFKQKKADELSSISEESRINLARTYKEGDAINFPATPRLTLDQRTAVINDAQTKGIPIDQALRNANLNAGLTGRNSIPNENIFDGYSPERSEQLLAQDIQRSEVAVKSTLLNSGATHVTPRQFDALVSMHNQLGDINYAYVDGKKVDLTGMYGRGEWNRAAGFIAADERDRPRRQREVNIMVNGDYGNPRTQQQVINSGLIKTNELYQRGKLDHQTGGQSSAQIEAAARSWLLGTGKQMPALNFAQRLRVQNNITTPPTKWGY